MATNRLRGTDPSIFGGELAARIKRYGELVDQSNEADARLTRAGQAVQHAEASAIADAAAARVSGTDGASTTDTESEAKDELALAQREAQIASQAVRVAGDEVEAEVIKHGDAYKAKLAKRADAASQTGLNVLVKLEEALHDLRVAKAYTAWLDRPGSGTNLRAPQIGEAFAQDSTVRRPNGEPAAVSTLTAAIHDVLAPATHAQGDQRAPWGIPVGPVQKVAA